METWNMVTENGQGMSEHKQRQELVKGRLRKKIKKGSNVVVYAGHGRWWLARALGPPMKLSDQEGGVHTRLHNGSEWLAHNTEVVFVQDYDNTAPWTSQVTGLDDTLPTVARVAARVKPFSPSAPPATRCAHTSVGRHTKGRGSGKWGRGA